MLFEILIIISYAVTMSVVDLIAQTRSGVAQILYENKRERVGNGSAFLVDGGIITNSHVLHPEGQVDAFAIRFTDMDSDDSALDIRGVDQVLESGRRSRKRLTGETGPPLLRDEPSKGNVPGWLRRLSSGNGRRPVGMNRGDRSVLSWAASNELPLAAFGCPG